MKIITKTKEDGRKLRLAIQETDSEEEAGEIGIDVGVPDLDQLDWDRLKVEVHNALHDAGIFTKDDLVRKGLAVKSLVCVLLTRELSKVYGE